MPRKKRQSKFHGVPAWKKDIKEDSVEEQPEGDSNFSLSPTCSSHLQLQKSNYPTVSQRKLMQSRVSSTDETESDDDNDCQIISNPEGYRLIDLQVLSESLSSAHKCKNAKFELKEDTSQRRWLYTELSLVCSRCSYATHIPTSRQRSVQGQSYDVNRRVSYAMGEVGGSRSTMMDICSIFNMPPPSNPSTWSEHNKAIYNALMQELSNELQDARCRLRKIHMAENSDLTEDDLLDVVVSYDGTWHKRGFTSIYGVGVLMSMDTGEVVDVHVLSKTCEDCKSWGHMDPQCETFKTWKEEHEASGKCRSNYAGSSPAMEMKAAEVIFTRSETERLRYTSVVSDGDSKTITNLNDNVKPYGDAVTIQKLECINHVHKRLFTNLKNLRQKNATIKGGRHGLSDAKIKTLSSYYRITVYKHQSKHFDNMDESVECLRNRLLAGMYHNVDNADPDVQHQYCPIDEWCKYKNDQKEGTSTYDNSDKLPEEYLPHMLPIYKRLSDPKLLEKCIPGFTQNQIESFNKLIWSRRPKETNVGPRAIWAAVASAVLHWNFGASSRERVMKRMDISPGRYSRRSHDSKDMSRIKRSVLSAEEKEKKKRKAASYRKIVEENKIEEEGVTYGAGAF